MDKENNSDESDFSENVIPDLNSLRPFNIFEPKTNLGDSGSHDKDEGVSNNEWCECNAKAVVDRCSSE